ncbi:SDR family NAD(P)-dependent oxidoreductase [Deinococcus sp. JMULE3]|uniref:SDR family NAD(P)-dependent oxidoreductase n=1 Tax=Deinococcus sp. JMULE3 TaxID=2518341 RepID=UPI001576D18B|nr:SDR family oxidoreductase [Deinococcus sp. JMULE3]NTY02390.1 SDR family oxidoreductase [Deinococcus sp. JMULE3]
MNLNLRGRRALITGSTLGIGRALAETLLREGASVIVHGRDHARVGHAAEMLSELGPVDGIAADLSTPQGAADLTDFTRRTGGIDILVNNVGAFGIQPFFTTGDDAWTAAFELNVLSGVRLARAFMPDMLARGWGRVIFISSEQALKPSPDMLPYATSKAAQVAVARGLAELSRGTAVTVNSVLVAPTWSPGVQNFLGEQAARGGDSLNGTRQAYFERGDGQASLLGRFAHPQEIADAVAFLASPNAAAINGTAYRVDGGLIRAAT